jgi:hypothetical protein
MSISFACEHCGKAFQVSDDLAGKKGKCKKCGGLFIIPGARVTARPAVARAAKPVRPAVVNDPYGLDESELPSSGSYDMAQGEVENEPPLSGTGLAPELGKARAKPKKKILRIRSSMGPVGWLFAISGGFLLVALILSPFTFNGFLIFGYAVLLVALVQGIWGGSGCLFLAFRESMLCGLLFVTIPFYWLYYVISRWGEVYKHVLVYISGFILLGIGYMLVLIGGLRPH